MKHSYIVRVKGILGYLYFLKYKGNILWVPKYLYKAIKNSKLIEGLTREEAEEYNNNKNTGGKIKFIKLRKR
jgi:hypothetical protein